MKSWALGISPLNLFWVASHCLTSSMVKHFSVQGQINLFLWSFTWMLCFGIVVSPCINLYYTNSLQPQWTKQNSILFLSVFITTVRELNWKGTLKSFQQVWWGFRCCESSVSSCFFFLNLNGICQAGSGPRLGIIPFRMILRMELKMSCCWKVLWNRGAGCACVHACTSACWVTGCALVCRPCFAASRGWSLDCCFPRCWFGFRYSPSLERQHDRWADMEVLVAFTRWWVWSLHIEGDLT